MTPTSEHTGTTRYLAIELVENEKAWPTAASDVYALGCLGLEVIFARKPYEQRKNNLRNGLYNDIKRGLPPAIPDSNLNSLESRTWFLLELCWSFDPSSRPRAQVVLTGAEKLLSPNPKTSPLRFEQNIQEEKAASDWNDPLPSFWTLGQIVLLTLVELDRETRAHPEVLFIFSVVTTADRIMFFHGITWFMHPYVNGIPMSNIFTPSRPAALSISSLFWASRSCLFVGAFVAYVAWRPVSYLDAVASRGATSSDTTSQHSLFRHTGLRRCTKVAIVAPPVFFLSIIFYCGTLTLVAFILTRKYGVVVMAGCNRDGRCMACYPSEGPTCVTAQGP